MTVTERQRRNGRLVREMLETPGWREVVLPALQRRFEATRDKIVTGDADGTALARLRGEADALRMCITEPRKYLLKEAEA